MDLENKAWESSSWQRGTHRDPSISYNMDFPGGLTIPKTLAPCIFLQVTVLGVATFLPLLFHDHR